MVALNNGLSGAVESILGNDSPVLFTSLHTDKESLAPQNFLASMEFNYAEFYPRSCRPCSTATRSGSR